MGCHYGRPRCYLDGNMTITFSNKFFTDLRDAKREVQDQSMRERADAFLASVVTEDEDGESIDLDALRAKLINSKLFDDDNRQRIQIDELVAKIAALTPNVRALKPGVYVIIGQASKGKTRWLRNLLAQFPRDDEAVLLSHDEPKLQDDQFGTSRGLAELLACFDAIRHMEYLNVVALDGIRTIQYESSGNTLSGGVNSGFFRFLTDAGNAAVDAGVVCLFTYNPNTEKDETYKVVAAMVDGSVQGIIDLNTGTIRSRYHKRESFDLSRAFDILFTDAISKEIESAQETTSQFDETEL